MVQHPFMRTKTDLIAAARSLAGDLELDMHWVETGESSGWWAADSPSLRFRIAGRATAALDLLYRYAGEQSQWTVQAVALYGSQGDRRSAESGARAVGELLRVWAEQLEAGVVEVLGAASWRQAEAASTDVMTLVRDLLEDPQAHPGPPMVMCGAALEIALRALADAKQVTTTGVPTLGTLSTALRGHGTLSKQDVKDIEMCAGLRNEAAHGHFDQLTMERAGLLEQQTNLLLDRFTELLDH